MSATLTPLIISLACVSSETNNLQRTFRPGRGAWGVGVLPYIGYKGKSGAKGYVFLAALV